MNSIRDIWKAIDSANSKRISQHVLAGMSAEFKKIYRLGDLDDELYNHCKKLMAGYKDTIAVYERFQNDIKSPDVKEIIDGIITVLVSRLREFEDVSPNSGANPLIEEKNKILFDVMESMAAELANDSNDVKILYEAFLNCLYSVKVQLNDVENRRVLQLYLTLMEDEWEILSTIIKIQVKALEEAVQDGDNVLEKLAVHKILTLLREAYQYFGRASTEISGIFHHLENTGNEWQPVSFDDFKNMIDEQMNNHDEALVAAAKALLDKETEKVLGQLKTDFFKSVYRFRTMINNETMLADEMTKIFINLRENWPDNEDSDILKGVAETIEIKIDSLRESINELIKDCNKLIDSTLSAHSSESDGDLEAVKSAVWQTWMANPDVDISQDEIPAIEERKNIQNKKIEHCCDTLQKKLTRFKREVLLYEISTYEEIIFYSISRLRETDEHTEAVMLADDTILSLQTLLKKNNIDVICPQPHDMFNPKEHEILIAESNPGFAKGEIVKLMNSGYRQGDVVLLRANVIAAR